MVVVFGWFDVGVWGFVGLGFAGPKDARTNQNLTDQGF